MQPNPPLPPEQQPLPPPPKHHHHLPPRPPPRRLTYYAPSPSLFAAKPKTPAQTSESPFKIILHEPHRTSSFIWFVAFICLLFSLLLILFGISTLIIFLVLKPRYPAFDIPTANLSAIYLDSPGYLTADFSFLANFSNPNQKLDVRFRAVDLQLMFADRVIAEGSVVNGFALRRKGGQKVGVVRMISSLVQLPLEVAKELQSNVESNKVEYEVRGRFRISVKVMGGLGFSYWLRSKCLLELARPPNGVLLSRSCSTRR